MTAEWILKVFVRSFDEPNDVAEGVHIVAIVSDSLSSENESLIEDIVKGLSGQSFLLAALGRDGVVGTTDTRNDLRTSIEDHLRNAIPPGATLTWEESDGVVRATFGLSREQNDSAPIILGAAALPFASSLGSTEVAAVLWDDSALDAHSAAGVWNILMSLEGQRIGQLRRLFVFAGGSIRYDLHIDSPKPARFWNQSDGLDDIKRPAHLAHRAEHLKRLCAEGAPLVLFLGSGFSATSGDDVHLPLGDTLRDDALLDMFGPEGTDDSRKHLFYDLVADAELWTPAEISRGLPTRDEFISALTLERVLLVEFSDQGTQTRSPTLQRLVQLNEKAIQAPSVGVRRLFDLVELGVKLVLVTVNFDTLVETVCGPRLHRLSTPEELESSDQVVAEYLAGRGKPGSEDRRIPLLKLHGSIDELETIVADVGSVATGLPSGVSAALELLTNEERPIPWVFVGHSMRDRDVLTVIEQRSFMVGTDELWVCPGLPSPVRDFAADHRSMQWTEHGLSMRHATVTSDRFFAELALRWATS